jgi:hypothetical protein
METDDNLIGRRALMVGSAAAAASIGLGTLGALPAEAAVRPRRRAAFAVWDPITGKSTTAMSPKRVTVHIAVTRSADIYGPGKGAGGTYAHFYNPRSGAPRQHQYMDRRAAADLNGNATSISVEHAGLQGDKMTDTQLRNLAKIFAWAVIHCGVPNRIATVHDLSGLAWHRLGIDGNFGTFDRHDRTTWCRKQTGAVWSSATGKLCPTDKFIRQIPTVYSKAQYWLKEWGGRPG